MSSAREPARTSFALARASIARACACAMSSRRDPFFSSSSTCAAASRCAIAPLRVASASSSCEREIAALSKSFRARSSSSFALSTATCAATSRAFAPAISSTRAPARVSSSAATAVCARAFASSISSGRAPRCALSRFACICSSWPTAIRRCASRSPDSSTTSVAPGCNAVPLVRDDVLDPPPDARPDRDRPRLDGAAPLVRAGAIPEAIAAVGENAHREERERNEATAPRRAGARASATAAGQRRWGRFRWPLAREHR